MSQHTPATFLGLGDFSQGLSLQRSALRPVMERRAPEQVFVRVRSFPAASIIPSLLDKHLHHNTSTVRWRYGRYLATFRAMFFVYEGLGRKVLLTYLSKKWQRYMFLSSYRGADNSLARPGRKQATATEGFEFHISYL
jgi:hypothetical protein